MAVIIFMSEPAASSQPDTQEQPSSQQPTASANEDPNVAAFREGIASLILPHLESCSTDLNTVFAAQETVLGELKRMETAIAKLSQFKTIPKLAQYCDRVKACRKRVNALSSLLDTIQQRIARF